MKNKRILIAWVALISWMSIIFLMSHQPGNISSSQSDFVLKIFSIIGIDLNSSLGEVASLLVRKAAHFSEYFILYLLNINLLKHYYPKKKARVFSMIGVFLYASSDEIHQYFIPGRAMAFTDVMIDCIGGFSAALIEYIISSLKENNKLSFRQKDIPTELK